MEGPSAEQEGAPGGGLGESVEFNVRLGSFITKGFGPQMSDDGDMFASQNQCIVYLSRKEMEANGLQCGSLVLVRTKEKDSAPEGQIDTTASVADALEQLNINESDAVKPEGVSFIAVAWMHPKAVDGTINFSLLLRRTMGIKNSGTKSRSNDEPVFFFVRSAGMDLTGVVPAKRLTVTMYNPYKTAKAIPALPKGFSQYMCQLIGGRLVTKGTPFSVSMFGTSYRCTVSDARGQVSSPQDHPGSDSDSDTGIFLVKPWTRLIIQQEEDGSKHPAAHANDRNRGKFEHIGGLKDQVENVRQMVYMPLHQPEVFSNIGVRPPKGVLLYGPPGTGKTLLAQAVSQDADASFFAINGPELLSTYVGESEGALRDVFDRAVEEQPAIIFIDEIDALCPRRDGKGEDGAGGRNVEEVDKRMVSTLLTLMDGASTCDNERVVVIAATNRPDAIDQALRRPGRFDRELEIGIPNKTGRKEILNCLLRAVPHNFSDSDVQRFASITHGFVGADLKALVQEASLNALLRLSENVPSASGGNDQSTGAFLLQPEDFAGALETVKPSALRELAIDVPAVRWTDIGGQTKAKQRLQEAVEWPLKHPELFADLGIRPSKGILLYGPPGCSKTLMAKAVATESSMNFIAVKGPELLSQWVGDSEKAVRDLFKKARAAAPTVVFFDEIDALATKRGGGGDAGSKVIDRVLSQILVELDGVEPLNQVIVLAATNRPDMLDAALLRPGRIDYLVHVNLPEKEARAAILDIHLRKIPYNKESVGLESLAEKTEGYTGAELAAVCREAAFVALEENMSAELVEMKHFVTALERVLPQTNSEMLDFYEEFSLSVRRD
jgi:AAA family ATPase